MNGFIERVNLIIHEMFANNKAAFSRAIGVNPQTLASYFNGKVAAKPSVEFAIKVSKELDIDGNWLLSGEGEMKRQHNHQQIGDISNSSVHGVNINGKDIRMDCPIAQKENIDAYIQLFQQALKSIEESHNQTNRLIRILEQTHGIK
ncbi:MAG: helix-turn-helix transcriptional regulator [Muribaculaceae bacterium]|nr:helix-turn-helix transcriptional regulator [Muribaculaceae bacterium]